MKVNFVWANFHSHKLFLPLIWLQISANSPEQILGMCRGLQRGSRSPVMKAEVPSSGNRAQLVITPYSCRNSKWIHALKLTVLCFKVDIYSLPPLHFPQHSFIISRYNEVSKMQNTNTIKQKALIFLNVSYLQASTELSENFWETLEIVWIPPTLRLH